MSVSEFFNMGGYGVYIWPCYVLTAIVLTGMGIASRRALTAEQTRALRRAQAKQEQSL